MHAARKWLSYPVQNVKTTWQLKNTLWWKRLAEIWVKWAFCTDIHYCHSLLPMTIEIDVSISANTNEISPGNHQLGTPEAYRFSIAQYPHSKLWYGPSTTIKYSIKDTANWIADDCYDKYHELKLNVMMLRTMITTTHTTENGEIQSNGFIISTFSIILLQ